MKLIFIPSIPTLTFYLKPDTALLRNNQPFFYPDFTKDIQATLSLVLRVNRLGRSISKQFAARYFDGISVGLDIVANDLVEQCCHKQLPQDSARSFDYTAPIAPEFIAPESNINNYRLQFFHNKNEICAAAPLFSHNPEEIIAHVSQFMTLKIGDYIYINTPLSAGPLQIGDSLRACLNGKEMLKMEVK